MWKYSLETPNRKIWWFEKNGIPKIIDGYLWQPMRLKDGVAFNCLLKKDREILYYNKSFFVSSINSEHKTLTLVPKMWWDVRLETLDEKQWVVFMKKLDPKRKTCDIQDCTNKGITSNFRWLNPSG